jgi:putative PIN family toxin of toxin-antitoxin system
VSRQAVIVDTSVVVAGLLPANETSPVARILDGMLAAVFPFVVSEALLAEYHTVLVRPKLRKLHGLTFAEVEAILTDLAQHAILLAPTATARAPNRGDQLLSTLLAARADMLLVTGDKRLLQDAGMKGRIIAPFAFVAGARKCGAGLPC